MQYCAQCGTPLAAEASNQRVCKTCMETAAGIQAEAGSPAAVDLKNWRSYKDLLLGLLRSPERSMQGAAEVQGLIPGTVAAGAASLLLSIITLAYIRNLYGWIGSLFGRAEYLWSGGMGFDIPYARIFFQSLLLFLLQWVILSAVLVLGAKLVKRELAYQQAANIAGFVKFFFAVAAIAGMLAGFLNLYLGIGVYGGALALSILLLYNGIRPLIRDGAIYYTAGSLAVYYIAQLFLIRLFL